MKLSDFTRAPNPRRVRIFLAEKGITVPMEQVDLFTGANRTPEALRRNPYGGLPVLELDDGACIAESVAICRYFEDLHPQPALMGGDAKDRAVVEMWNRRMELVLFAHIGRYFQQTSEIFKTRIKQMPEVAEVAREAALAQMRMIRRLHRRAPLYRRRALHDRRHHGDGRARARGGRRADSGFRPRKPDALVRRGVGAAERPHLMGTVASAISDPGRPGRFRDVSENPGLSCRGTKSSSPSPSSRQSVSRGISPSCIEKTAVAAACTGSAGRHGRQRRVGPVNITPTAGNISVGPYSSTAAPARRSRRGCTGVPSEVGLAV
jgi:glutathione S-transferase